MANVGAVLEAYAVGDAMGMPTEFMTRKAIRERFGPLVDRLVDPREGQNHPNLPFASVTDDTEQVCYLLKTYRAAGRVEIGDTVETLERWIQQTGADVKGYIGPSAKRALEAIRSGVAPEKAGEGGVTCGGIMRAPAAVLYKDRPDDEGLYEDLFRCLAPTHNTSTALEAAGAYGAAMAAALRGSGAEAVLAAAERGAQALKRYAPYDMCAPSCIERIRFGREIAQQRDATGVLDTLYDLLGTGLPSADVCGAVFAIFCHAGKDVWLAIRMGASVGGDTDTIAALSGALCAAFAGGHNIPPEVQKRVLDQNKALLGDVGC